MQMNHMYELQKQMGTATPVSQHQFSSMHAQLLGASNPQQQAILNQQHLITQQLSQQQQPITPILAPLKRGRKANEDGDNRKRRKKDPNRPKRAMTPYFYFTAEYRNSLRREGKAVPGVKEVAQYCGPKWNSMNETEKRPFIILAEGDRKRYLGEMNIYKKPRDEEKPKRPASAYFHFLVEFRKKMAGKPLPEHTTIPKLSGALWQKMTEEERRPYNDKMEEEKKVYERRLAEYRKNFQMKAEEAIKNAKKKEEESKQKSTSGYSEYSRNYDAATSAAAAAAAAAVASQSTSAATTAANSLNMAQQLTQYSDINRHLQMMNQDGKTSWQNQLQNMQAAQAAQAAHHYAYNPHYSDIYNSPGTSSHSDSKLQDNVQNLMIPNLLQNSLNNNNNNQLPSISSLQSSIQLMDQQQQQQMQQMQQQNHNLQYEKQSNSGSKDQQEGHDEGL